MNNPFEYVPDARCEKAYRKLIERLEGLKSSSLTEDVNFIDELEAGKMLGVLIAEDEEGSEHALYAFSGQLGGGGFHYPGFVDPVFDYLQPDGYFKTHEALISALNREIISFENETLAKVKKEYEEAKKKIEPEIEEYKEICRQSKMERDAKRKSGNVTEAEKEAMIRQSQFEKAELKRIKGKVAEKIEPFANQLKEAEGHLERLKEKRKRDSENLQQWLFSNFQLLNAKGESRSLSDIFANTSLKIPPSGAGECCAPKLLQVAYLRGWKPVEIAEYWYGKAKGGEVRRHGDYYPACRGKCLPVLSWMLQGLEIIPPLNHELREKINYLPEIIYENQWFCVVNKPSGMLSVPGKGAAFSLQQWLAQRYGSERNVKLAHRLDQDTSGLIVATFGEISFKVMQRLFAMRRVKKTYIADLDGDYEAAGLPRHGKIELPLTADWLDRPRQKIDFEGGKEALTDYEFLYVKEGRSRVEFHPHTGRTHQLRVHAASPQGLGMSIVGDRLYGQPSAKNPERLHLHSQKIEFTFPIDRKDYIFELPVPF